MRVVFLIAGLLALSAGIVGIFLPVLPTTPFLLLAAACFLRSSKRLYNWLTRHRWLGDYIKSYLKFRAVSTGSKVVAIILLWSTIVVTAVFFARPLWLRILLGVVAVGVTIHLLCLKTLTVEMREALRKERESEDQSSDSESSSVVSSPSSEERASSGI